MVLRTASTSSIPARRFSSAARSDQDNPKTDEQRTHLFLAEYQFSQFSGPAVRRSRECGIKFGRANSICSRLKDLEVDEEATDCFMTLGCDEFAVDLWPDKTLLDKHQSSTNTNVRVLKLSRPISYFFQVRNSWKRKVSRSAPRCIGKCVTVLDEEFGDTHSLSVDH
jgi:hypothetical protein